MSRPHPTSYRAVRELLHDVCRRHCPAEVVSAAARDHAAAVHTRFLAQTDQHFLLDWSVPDATATFDGAPVRILFQHQGQTLAAIATPHGPTHWQAPGQPPCRAWAFRVPVRVAADRRRRQFRLTLPESPPVEAALTRAAGPADCFTAHLRNLSPGGFSGMATAAASALRVGQILRAAFELPRAGAFEFIARVVHVRRTSSGQSRVFGCTFCGADDESTTAAQLRRIESYIAQQAQGSAPAAPAHD